MMYRDDEPSATPDSQHAMISNVPQPGDALVVQSNGAPHAGLPVPTMLSPGPQHVLRGGMDANTFLHALRRRWLLATCMGLVIGFITGAILWWAFPESSSATALFQVSNEQQSLVFELNRNSPNSFEILKKTQLAMLQSHFVLQSAIRNPGVSSLSILAGEADPIKWLQQNLDVDYPNQGEILSITLSGSPSADLVQLVSAVAKAYEDEVIFEAHQRRLGTRDLLAASLKKVQEEVERKLQDFLDIARDSGKTPTNQKDPVGDLLLNEIATLQRKKADLETRMIQYQTDFAVMKSKLEDPALLDAQADEMLQADPQISMMQQQLMMLQYQKIQTQATARRGNNQYTANIDKQIAMLNAHIQQYRNQVKQQMLSQAQSAPNVALQQLTKEFQTQFNAMRMQWAGADQALTKKLEDLTSRGEISVDMELREQELDQLKEIANDMSIKLESIDVELTAPRQITKVQDAVPQEGINTAQHYSIAILGGLAAFGLTCLGIAYVEFLNRRLNDAEQVDEGLGIRVIGTLPSLASRRALDPTHPIVAQLTESIDGVRTLLMHDSTSKRRQIVLVTSAAAAEGRTTVASQLAASLARAGRRTLLIDGDLRRPALHSLFDVPLEDGLCEVLRAEVDVADVIRPTHAEGLWLLTAGYCDIDAIHALATEQMQPVFDKLRGEYDFIIIDGAPVLGMSDALIFGQYSDGAVLSVRRDHSQMGKIHQAAELLRGVGIRIIGSVVNGMPAKADDRITQMRLIAPKSERQLQPTS